LLPAPTLTELAYHFSQIGGTKEVVRAMRAIRQGRVSIIELQGTDYDRSLEILDKYADSRIDFVDACIMALAERLKITRILTFDHRDFGLYRPAHVERFDLQL
jgi:predicted nucleic acid-binding protein